MSVVLNLVTAEALALAESCGVAREVAIEVMRATPADL